jgi:hypothetical protein
MIQIVLTDLCDTDSPTLVHNIDATILRLTTGTAEVDIIGARFYAFLAVFRSFKEGHTMLE